MKVKATNDVDVGGRLMIDDVEVGDRRSPTHMLVKQFGTEVGPTGWRPAIRVYVRGYNSHPRRPLFRTLNR
jgi:hypothetical protein